MNQHYFDVPFAFSGDVAAIPDPLQTGGTVSFTEGWNYNYQRDLATDPAALPIDRSTMNWLLLQITTALQALQQAGCPEFITSAQNGGTAFSYGKGSRVLWSASGSAPFTKFVNLNAGNTNTPSLSDPTGATTGWQIDCDPIATSAMATAGTDNASIMTPLLVAQQTALRALLAGNSSQVFNVANATSATHAVAFGQISGVVGQARNLFMSVTAASASATLTADEIIVESALGGLRYCLSSFNKTINLATIGAGGMDTGSAPISGYIALYAIYNPTTQTAALLAKDATTAVQPNVYGGSSMPAGYTASALLTVYPTNASGQFKTGVIIDRWVYFSYIQVLLNGSATTATSVSLAPAVPMNAKEWKGTMGGAPGNAPNGFHVGADANFTGYVAIISPTAGGTIASTTSAIPIITAQVAYYACDVSGSYATISVSAYRI